MSCYTIFYKKISFLFLKTIINLVQIFYKKWPFYANDFSYINIDFANLVFTLRY